VARPEPTLEPVRYLRQRRVSPVIRGGVAEPERELLRREIQRFTVRRTNAMLNGLVDQDPEAYRDRVTSHPNRYPVHTVRTYDTGETARDAKRAETIRCLAEKLRGIAAWAVESGFLSTYGGRTPMIAG
jgi:hypothetical protein